MLPSELLQCHAQNGETVCDEQCGSVDGFVGENQVDRVGEYQEEEQEDNESKTNHYGKC